MRVRGLHAPVQTEPPHGGPALPFRSPSCFRSALLLPHAQYHCGRSPRHAPPLSRSPPPSRSLPSAAVPYSSSLPLSPETPLPASTRLSRCGLQCSSGSTIAPPKSRIGFCPQSPSRCTPQSVARFSAQFCPRAPPWHTPAGPPKAPVSSSYCSFPAFFYFKPAKRRPSGRLVHPCRK